MTDLATLIEDIARWDGLASNLSAEDNTTEAIRTYSYTIAFLVYSDGSPSTITPAAAMWMLERLRADKVKIGILPDHLLMHRDGPIRFEGPLPEAILRAYHAYRKEQQE